jgi:hypothetical protein
VVNVKMFAMNQNPYTVKIVNNGFIGNVTMYPLMLKVVRPKKPGIVLHVGSRNKRII